MPSGKLPNFNVVSEFPVASHTVAAVVTENARGAVMRGCRLESDQGAGRPDLRVLHAQELGTGHRLLQGHLPLVQIAGIGRALQ
jgi:hypothetical protein